VNATTNASTRRQLRLLFRGRFARSWRAQGLLHPPPRTFSGIPSRSRASCFPRAIRGTTTSRRHRAVWSEYHDGNSLPLCQLRAFGRSLVRLRGGGGGGGFVATRFACSAGRWLRIRTALSFWDGRVESNWTYYTNNPATPARSRDDRDAERDGSAFHELQTRGPDTRAHFARIEIETVTTSPELGLIFNFGSRDLETVDRLPHRRRFSEARERAWRGRCSISHRQPPTARRRGYTKNGANSSRITVSAAAS